MNEAEKVAKRLYEARIAKEKAKKLRAELGDRLGRCEVDLELGTPCYQSNKIPNFWCDICKRKLPVHLDYRKKAIECGVALRAVLRIGKAAK